MPEGSAGQDAPEVLPLMLVPGTLCDARLFAPLQARLAGQRTYVADLDEGCSIEAFAERILATAPARFALLGFSLGAIVATAMTLRAPARVAGVALVGGTARPIAPAQQAARRALLASARPLRAHLTETLWPRYVADPADPMLLQTILAMAETCPADTLARQEEAALTRVDLRPVLHELAIPALVLAGAADVINPPDVQRELAEATGARLALIAGAGHFVLLERPDACAHAVTDWLADIDAIRATRAIHESFPKEQS